MRKTRQDKAQHDQFFKYVFSKPQTARTFFSNYLPPQVCNLLDFTSISVLKDSFVDAKMRVHLSDLLYQIQLKEPGQYLYIYILFEHKSYADEMVALQLLRYMVTIWHHSQKKGKKLIGILPIVFYHGEKAWQAPTNFQALIDAPPALREYMPEFRYHLCNISQIEDEDIKGDAELKAALFSMKYVPRKDIKEKLDTIFRFVLDIEAEETLMAMTEAMLAYLPAAKTKLTIEDIEKVIQEISEERGKNMNSFVDVWVERGKMEGIQLGKLEGIQEGKLEGIRDGLLEGLEIALDIKFGTKGLGLMSELRKIKDIETLKSIRGALKTANSAQELRRLYVREAISS